MEAAMSVRELLPILLPLIVIQLGLLIFSLVDLFRAERHVRWLPKPAWALIIIFGQMLGPIIYLVSGREEG
jgi:hypothetical protein